MLYLEMMPVFFYSFIGHLLHIVLVYSEDQSNNNKICFLIARPLWDIGRLGSLPCI